MQDMAVRLSGYLSKLSLPSLGVTDILEIALISFFIYQFMVWIKFTRAYTLLKGILIVLLFILFAYVLKMNTILWIFRNLANVLVIGVIVIFQPECCCYFPARTSENAGAAGTEEVYGFYFPFGCRQRGTGKVYR